MVAGLHCILIGSLQLVARAEPKMQTFDDHVPFNDGMLESQQYALSSSDLDYPPVAGDQFTH